MAEKKNTFTPNINQFFEQATDLHHVFHFLHWQLKLAEEPVKKSLEVFEKKGMRNSFGSATASSIVNIFNDDEYIIRARIAKRTTRGDDILHLASEIRGRFNGTILVSLHEIFEVYLKYLYGKMLYQLRNRMTIRDKKRFHNARQEAAKHQGTARYYSEYANWSCRRDCKPALKTFQRELDWSTVVINRYFEMDPIVLADALAFCRHCIVHVEGHVSATELSKLSEAQKKFVRILLDRSVVTKDDRILPDKEITAALLEAVMSFAYGLYKLLSQRCGMKIEVDPWQSKGEQK